VKVWLLISRGEDAAFAKAFSSRERALTYLAHEDLGEEEAARLVWRVSPHNPDFQRTEDEHSDIILYAADIDAGLPDAYWADLIAYDEAREHEVPA
jgi:hypothetical protein